MLIATAVTLEQTITTTVILQERIMNLTLITLGSGRVNDEFICLLTVEGHGRP